MTTASVPRQSRRRIRSLLFAPGNQPRKLERVFDFHPDAVNLDLEDSVPPAEKEVARGLVRETVQKRLTLNQAQTPAIVVRVNSPETDLIEDDLKAVVVPGVFAIQLTKIGSIGGIKDIDAQVTALEKKNKIAAGSIHFITSVDRAHLVLNLPELARSSPRLYCFIIGGADFALDIGLSAAEDMVESLWARSYGVLVSRDAGLAPPVHPPHFNLADAEGYKRLVSAGKRLGFQGAIALHPRQVEWAHEVFSPTQAEVLHAREVIEQLSKAEAEGKGAIQLADGTFLDVAMAHWAKEVIHRSESSA